SNLTSVKDALDRETALGYDFRDRPTSTTLPDPDGAGSLASPVYLTGYDNLDRTISQTDPLSHETTLVFDDVNRTLTTTLPDPDGGGSLTSPVTVQSFDARGF